MNLKYPLFANITACQSPSGGALVIVFIQLLLHFDFENGIVPLTRSLS